MQYVNIDISATRVCKNQQYIYSDQHQYCHRRKHQQAQHVSLIFSRVGNNELNRVESHRTNKH